MYLLLSFSASIPDAVVTSIASPQDIEFQSESENDAELIPERLGRYAGENSTGAPSNTPVDELEVAVNFVGGSPSHFDGVPSLHNVSVEAEHPQEVCVHIRSDEGVDKGKMNDPQVDSPHCVGNSEVFNNSSSVTADSVSFRI